MYKKIDNLRNALKHFKRIGFILIKDNNRNKKVSLTFKNLNGVIISKYKKYRYGFFVEFGYIVRLDNGNIESFANKNNSIKII